MENRQITPEQEKIFSTIHNLIWHRITYNDKYLEAIPEQDSRDFHNHIYYIRYEFLEYDDSVLRAIVYLNGKHYEYTEAPQISKGMIWVNDIEDSEVKNKIIEIGGEIHEYFELYNTDLVLDEDEEVKMNKQSHDDEYDYEDLPF